MADGGVVNGFDYRTRTRDLGTPGRLLGPYSGPPSFPSLSSRDPVNPRDRHHLKSIPASSGVDTDVIWSQASDVFRSSLRWLTIQSKTNPNSTI